MHWTFNELPRVSVCFKSFNSLKNIKACCAPPLGRPPFGIIVNEQPIKTIEIVSRGIVFSNVYEGSI